ncbi:hypothetical protein ACWCXX_20000 [Streptomyces sp. NPDC001732]
MARSGMSKRALLASGAAVLLSAGALGTTSALADSSGTSRAGGGAATVAQAGAKAKGTPDGYVWNAYIKNHRYADVIWDDYTSNGADVDSITIDDANLDGRSSQLRVYKSRTGPLWKKVHAHNGGTKTIDVNIKKGKKIYFEVCGYNDGAKQGCTGRRYFRE